MIISAASGSGKTSFLWDLVKGNYVSTAKSTTPTL